MNLLGAARRRAAACYGLLALLSAAGIYAALRLPASIFPSVTFPIVKVIADVGDEPAARMMPTVTRPLEEAILRVPGVQLVRSTTSRGSTEISAEFDWGTDMQVALQRVQAEGERVRPDLPPDARIEVEWMNTAIFPIEGYALTSRNRSQAELWDLAEFTLKPALMGIAGVAQVQVQGGRRREFQVWLDPNRLAGRRLAVSDVVEAVRKSHAVLSAGLTEQNHELYLALVDGRAHDLETLSRMAVPVAGGPPATLAELGELRTADEVSYIRTTANGAAAVLLNIIRQPSANTVTIADGVQRLLRDNPALLPPDVQWTTFYDQARFVTDSVRGTRDAIVIGVVLAGVVLLAFLRDRRITLVAVATIPFTVALVGLALAITGQTVNLMTLAGIAAAIGLIADDAIVVTEHVERHRAEGRSDDPAESAVRELLPALIGSSLSTIVILLPFALLAGLVGAFFKPLALTMALALVASFALSVLLVPVALGSGGRRRSAPGRWSRFEEAFERFAAACIRRQGAALTALALCLLGTALLYRVIGTDFLPAMDEGAIILDYWTPPGTSLTDTDAMLGEAEKIILALPDVASYSRRTGTQLGFFITEPNRGDYVITLKPRGQRRDVDEVIDDLRGRLQAAEPAIHTDFGQLIEDDIGDLTGGVPQPIDIKVFGSDPVLLAGLGREIATILTTVRGVEDAFDGVVIAGPALQVRVDPVAAARYGLTTTDIQAAVEPAVTGTVVDQVRVGDRMYDLRIFARPGGGGPLADLRIRAQSNPGALIPLSTLAAVSTGAPEAEINRENLQTFVGVTARLSGRDLGGTVAEIQRRIAREVPLPPGAVIRYGGQYEQQESSFRGLFVVLLGSLVLVAVVVLFLFGDWRAPLATAICAIATLPGVLLALLVTGMTLNVSSYVGAIMMVGIVGENAIFVIHQARLDLAGGTPVAAAWARAARHRLRPVTMTILASAFALAPLALAVGRGAQLMQPLGVAVIGGFVFSGPVVLLLLPALYRWLDPTGRLAG